MTQLKHGTEGQVSRMRTVDADAMIKRLKAWDTNDATDKALYNFALNRVLEAPTVEPERKKGEWKEIDTCNAKVTLQYMLCSACKRWHIVPYYYRITPSEYCPRCGAKMQAEPSEGSGNSTN